MVLLYTACACTAGKRTAVTETYGCLCFPRTLSPIQSQLDTQHKVSSVALLAYSSGGFQTFVNRS